jgi:hypothetical protein
MLARRNRVGLDGVRLIGMDGERRAHLDGAVAQRI